MSAISSAELQDLYRERFSKRELMRRYQIWRVITAFLQRCYIPSSSRVLELACGRGELINSLSCAKRCAIDLNPDTAALLDPQVEFHHGDVIETLRTHKFDADTILVSNFLEHLPDREALTALLTAVRAQLIRAQERLIAAAGSHQQPRFIILGPNLRYLPGRYWDFWDHTLGLTHLSLCEALRLYGFEIEQCYDRFLPYTDLNPRLFKLPTHPALVALYLKNPWIWKILGRHFLIVARPQNIVTPPPREITRCYITILLTVLYLLLLRNSLSLTPVRHRTAPSQRWFYHD